MRLVQLFRVCTTTGPPTKQKVAIKLRREYQSHDTERFTMGQRIELVAHALDRTSLKLGLSSYRNREEEKQFYKHPTRLE